MASSTIGWRELPYASAPVVLEAHNPHTELLPMGADNTHLSDLKSEILPWKKPPSVGNTYLISGVASANDVLRGEETEAVGLLRTLATPPASLILLLPGTHSKHLHISGGILRNFQTYMTGELYSVLSQHSVLAASVSAHTPFHADGFFAGLDAARQHPLSAALFQTRTRQLLAKSPPDENAWFLSGVLVGAELQPLLRPDTSDLHLGGTPALRDLYGKALRYFDRSNWRAFSDEQCENSAVRGHQIILSRLEP